jgi:hypothetical protein
LRRSRNRRCLSAFDSGIVGPLGNVTYAWLRNQSQRRRSTLKCRNPQIRSISGRPGPGPSLPKGITAGRPRRPPTSKKRRIICESIDKPSRT